MTAPLAPPAGKARRVVQRRPPEPSVFEMALAALELGLSPVPIAANGTKRPTIRWKRLQQSPMTRQEVKDRFAGDVGLGLVCGQVSGGLELLEFEALAMELGLLAEFEAAMETEGLGELWQRVAAGYSEESPSGGRHYLYTCDEVDGNQQLAFAVDDHGKKHVLAETRGQGGYVTTAPSCGGVHPTGRPWRVIAGGLDTICHIEPEDRAAMLAVARRLDRSPRPSSAKKRPDGRSTPVRGRGLASNSHAEDRIDSWMDRIVADFNRAVPWEEVLAGWTWLQTDDREISYWTRPGKDPADGCSATTNATGTDRLIVFSSSVPEFEPFTGDGLAPSYDRFDAWARLNHGGDRVAAARALEAEGASNTVNTGRPGTALQVLTSSEIVNQPAPNWLWEDLIAERSLVTVFGPSNAGKTLLAIQLAVNVALGMPLLEHTTTAGTVLYIAAESSDQVGRRLDAWTAYNDCTVEELDGRLDWIVGPVNLADAREVDALDQHVIEHRPAVIVVDTLSRSMAGSDENAAKDINHIIEQIERLRAHGVTIILVHHSGKATANGARGSSALRSAVDTELEVTATGTHVTVKTTKQRNAAAAPPLRLLLLPYRDSVVLTLRTDADADVDDFTDVHHALLVDISNHLTANERLSANKLRQLLGGSNTATAEALRWLIANGHVADAGEAANRKGRYSLLRPYPAPEEASDEGEEGAL